MDKPKEDKFTPPNCCGCGRFVTIETAGLVLWEEDDTSEHLTIVSEIWCKKCKPKNDECNCSGSEYCEKCIERKEPDRFTE